MLRLISWLSCDALQVSHSLLSQGICTVRYICTHTIVPQTSHEYSVPPNLCKFQKFAERHCLMSRPISCTRNSFKLPCTQFRPRSFWQILRLDRYKTALTSLSALASRTSLTPGKEWSTDAKLLCESLRAARPMPASAICSTASFYQHHGHLNELNRRFTILEGLSHIQDLKAQTMSVRAIPKCSIAKDVTEVYNI